MDSVILGICIVFVGIGLLGNFTGFFNILFKGWWTIFIIAPATVNLFKKKNKTFNLILLSVGVVLLLYQQNIITGSTWEMVWKLLIAFSITLLGIKTVFSSISKRKKLAKNVADRTLCNAIFSGKECKYQKKIFHGAKLSAIFGGIKLNLVNAVIQEDVDVEVCAVFGGCTIILPKNVDVHIENNGFMGGVTDKSSSKSKKDFTVNLKSTTFFGGIDIKTEE